jgi:phage gpG-like protein
VAQVTGRGGVTVAFDPPVEFILRQTGAFRRSLENLEPLWARVAPLMAEIEERWFDTGGDGSWPPLAESTLAQKARRGFPADPLVATGDLKDSLVDPARAGNVGPGYLAWETDVAYAGYHQDPSTPGRPPQRQVIPDPFPVEDRRKIETAIVTWVNFAAETFGRI